MCPLRFLLAGLSALLALLVAFHLLSGPESGPKPDSTGRQQTAAGPQKAEAKTWSSIGRAVLDFCTGKYLYDTVRWQLGSQRGSSSSSTIIKQ
ncbi:hypothetical protein WJX74_000913 [Apatococcus lobatus]|uniref:Uncharacterized protein n=1 Tax=Apatococcus lobatus TaxID=904363 RepID=A0AAW1SDH4_9CHLO